MAGPFTRIGKQILANGFHYADAADEAATAFILEKLNSNFNPLRKLCEAEVRAIRHRHALGERVSKIHADYPTVSVVTIHHIVKGKTWSHL